MATISIHLTSKNSNVNLLLLQQHLVQINNTSNDVLLRFTITCDKTADILAQDSIHFITELVQHIPSTRWELLHFEDLGIAGVFMPLLDSLQKNAWPNLKHLHLQASAESSYDIKEDMHLDAPLLQHLTLNCFIPITFTEQVSSTHFTNLVSLELDNYSTFPDLLRLLRQTPLVEKCVLRMHGDDILPARNGRLPMVGLPRLRELALISASNLSILYWLCTPILAKLQIEMMELLPSPPVPTPDTSALDQLCLFIESFCPKTLTHLKLAHCPFTDAHILRILSSTPELTNLCVWWGPTTGSLLQGLSLNIPLDTSSSSQAISGRIKCPKAPCYSGVPCAGQQPDPQIPLYAPHLTRIKLHLHPLEDVDGQRARLEENKNVVQWQRRSAFASLLCQAHRPLFDPYSRLPDLMVVEAVHRDEDGGKASSIDFGMD